MHTTEVEGKMCFVRIGVPDPMDHLHTCHAIPCSCMAHAKPAWHTHAIIALHLPHGATNGARLLPICDATTSCAVTRSAPFIFQQNLVPQEAGVGARLACSLPWVSNMMRMHANIECLHLVIVTQMCWQRSRRCNRLMHVAIPT